MRTFGSQDGAITYFKVLSWLLLALASAVVSCTTADRLLSGNIHLIDESSATGYKLYRSARPDADIMQTYCDLGIQEMMVIAGNAAGYEDRLVQNCPSLKVIYNQKQKSKEPLTTGFLRLFDQWVTSARDEGKIIAFRCDSGAHRTGRLAAYYQMKYNHITPEDAKIIMNEHGIWNFMYPHLYPQVDALYDFIHDRPCSVPPQYCVRDTDG